MSEFEQKIAVYGGTGWMGKAMLLPALNSGFLRPDQLTVINRNGQSMPGYPSVSIFTDDQKLCFSPDVVVLSVRPADFPSCQVECSNALVISIMAGVSVAEIAAHTGAKRIIRAMPNAAAECAESFTPFITTAEVRDNELDFADHFFSSFGSAAWLPSEDVFNYYVALTGSAHGTLAFFAASMLESALKQGLGLATAERGVRQVFKGIGKLIAEEENGPLATVDRVVTYAGTTAKLVTTLQEAGVSDDIHHAILASYAKASSNMTKK